MFNLLSNRTLLYKRVVSFYRRSSNMQKYILVGGCILLLFAVHWLYNAAAREETVDMNKLLAVSMVLAREGGDRLWSIKKGHSSGMVNLSSVVKGKTKEGADELLTKGDMESHRIIHSGLKKAFPGLKLVSEEHDELDGENFPLIGIRNIPDVSLLKAAGNIPLSDVKVWIDPLDATQEYTENLLHYVTTMVCVAVKGVPVIGVIYRPFANELVWGFVDHGFSSNLVSWLENKPKKRTTNSSKNIIVSRSHAGNVEKAVKDSMKNVRIIPAGGAGYKVLTLLNYTTDAYVHTTRIKKWDICAGNAILNAVSGRMTSLSGGSIDYSDPEKPQNDAGLLATLNHHERFIQVFKKLMKT